VDCINVQNNSCVVLILFKGSVLSYGSSIGIVLDFSVLWPIYRRLSYYYLIQIIFNITIILYAFCTCFIFIFKLKLYFGKKNNKKKFWQFLKINV